MLVELKGLTYGERLGIVLNHGPAPVILCTIWAIRTLAHPGIGLSVTDPTVSHRQSDYSRSRFCDCRSVIRSMTTAANVRRQRRSRPDDAVVQFNGHQWTAQWFHISCGRCRAIRQCALAALIPVTRRAVLDAQIAASGVSDRQCGRQVSPENHLQRLGAADLALDHPYGSHTTGADAFGLACRC